MVNVDFEVGFASSDLFCNPTLVMLESFFDNNEENYVFNFVYNDTSEITRKKFEKVIQDHGCVYKEWKVDESLFKDFIFLKRFGYTTYFRVVFPFIVGDECKKLFWIDSDTVVNGNIAKLTDLELDKSLYGVNMPEEQCYEKLGLSADDYYVNCGVILYNVERIRKKYSIDQALKFFVENKEKFTYVDQCFLNLFYRKDIGVIDTKYNDIIYRVCKFTTEEINTKSEESIILHFVGNIKPWKYLYANPIYVIYWKYGNLVYGKDGYIKWLILSRLFIVLSPFINIIKKFRKVNI